jgi:hypothetical protein
MAIVGLPCAMSRASMAHARASPADDTPSDAHRRSANPKSLRKCLRHSIFF